MEKGAEGIASAPFFCSYLLAHNRVQETGLKRIWADPGMKRALGIRQASPELCGPILGFVAAMAMGGSALAQDGSFFTNDMFIEEDVMIEGAFDSGIVVESFDETIEEEDEASSSDEQDYENE